MPNIESQELAPLVRAQQVAQFFGVSRKTVYEWVSAGRLPRPLKLSPGYAAWRRSDLLALVDELHAAAQSSRN